MGKNKTTIVWFAELDKEYIDMARGRGEDFAEMTGIDIPVPGYWWGGES